VVVSGSPKGGQIDRYIEENKYLNTLPFCKFSHLEIMEGSEIVVVGACPL